MKLQNFDNIYQNTYDNTLKFIVLKCNNIDDINDIIQDTYVELYHKLQKKDINVENENSYIVGIAKNIIKRHYRKMKNKNYEISINENDNIEIIDEVNLVDMNYIEKSGIKAKVESLIASNDEIRIKLAFEFDDAID